ncbi:MAG TPA: hypothetical protein VHS55_00220 [Solirubrobacteraceae bacterium]|jgi:hypothetical protein|nr:hypothetical protein [Solirubrobacteraceae bacterium]
MSRASRIALAVLALVVVLVLLAQALLPGVAATRVRARVERYGPVHSVHVSAFPAVELLWGQADSVSVSAGTLTATPAQIASLLWEARTIGTLTVLAQGGVLHTAQLPGALEVSDVRMQKRGSSVLASATMTQAQLQRAMPSGFSVQPTASGEGEIEARASGGLFGLQASLNVLVRASEGNLIAQPRGLPFGGIATVTLFSDAHLKVESVGLRVISRQPLTYGLFLRASLR